MTKEFRSGFVAIIGRPNVGKSTLMNGFAGEKVAITSNKPQTTRNRIQCVLSREDCQIVFIDTPGMHKPRHKLGEYMVRSISRAMSGVDAVLFVAEPRARISEADKDALERLGGVRAPIILVINKIDTVEKPVILSVMDSYKAAFDFKEMIPVSALKAENTDVLLKAAMDCLPPGPRYFPEDMVTDQPERQIAAEMIREKVLRLLRDEIPHGVAVEILGMKKRDGGGKELFDISANIYCEKDSHKGMIIGKNGAMLGTIGERARADLERLVCAPVYLQLWVRVKKRWRDDERLLRDFGYDTRGD